MHRTLAARPTPTLPTQRDTFSAWDEDSLREEMLADAARMRPSLRKHSENSQQAKSSAEYNREYRRRKTEKLRQAVVAALATGPAQMSDLVRITGLEHGQVTSAVMTLRKEGIIVDIAKVRKHSCGRPSLVYALAGVKP